MKMKQLNKNVQSFTFTIKENKKTDNMSVKICPYSPLHWCTSSHRWIRVYFAPHSTNWCGSPGLMTFGGIQRQAAACSTELILHFIMCNHGREDIRTDENVASNPKALFAFSSAQLLPFCTGQDSIRCKQKQVKEDLFKFLTAIPQAK